MVRRTLYYIIHWETWHWLAKYILILPVWVWYCIKNRTPWFFTSANPTLTFGGFFGETKREMYAQLPRKFYPKSAYVSSSEDESAVLARIAGSGLCYPVAVKPDAGMMGFMFRRIENAAELARYHRAMKADYIIQEWIAFPLEVSVFYYRMPDQCSGTITGFVKKEFLAVQGDGVRTLLDLITENPRTTFRAEELKAKHRKNLDLIIPQGESFILSHALNLSRGGKLVSLEREKDSKLLKIFDGLSLRNGNFFFGRYDIKCNSVNDLKAGKNFSILEFNGAGAEPHHVYGNRYSLFQAWSILLHHWKMLEKIAKTNSRNGVAPWKLREGWEHIKKAYAHFAALKELDLTFDLDQPVAALQEVSGKNERSLELPGAYGSDTIRKAG